MNSQRRTGRQRHCFFMGRIVGVLAIGFAVPAYAQVCDPLQTTQLLAEDGDEFDYFGATAAISGETAFVSSAFSDANGIQSGAVYVFDLIEGQWAQVDKLVPDTLTAGDMFGSSISIDGDTAVVGARSDDENGAGSGSVYVFTRSNGAWSQQAQLFPSDHAEGDFFGDTVSISGDSIVISASLKFGPFDHSGAAYVFTRTGDVWIQQAKLQADESTEFDEFGTSVSISNDRVLVGMPGDDENGMNAGSVFVFDRTDGVWNQTAKLFADDGGEGDILGASVVIDGGTAIVGARWDQDHGFQSGSAYIFVHNEGVWTQQAKLLPADGAAGDLFSSSISIHGDLAVIAARASDNGNEEVPDTGAVYAFVREGNIWSQQSKLMLSGGTEFESFGESVSTDGESIVIGAIGDDSNGIGAGASYIYDLNCVSCPADLTGDGSLNFFDVSAFLSAFGNADPIADFTGDGNFNFFDVSAFLGAFNAGCP